MRTDTVLITVIDGEAWDVTDGWRTTRYARPNRRETFARSAFAGHLRAATRAAFWPSALCSGAIVGLLLVDLSRAVL